MMHSLLYWATSGARAWAWCGRALSREPSHSNSQRWWELELEIGKAKPWNEEQGHYHVEKWLPSIRNPSKTRSRRSIGVKGLFVCSSQKVQQYRFGRRSETKAEIKPPWTWPLSFYWRGHNGEQWTHFEVAFLAIHSRISRSPSLNKHSQTSS